MEKLFLKNLKSFRFCLLVVFFIFIPMFAEAQKVVVAQGIDPEALDCHASINIPTMVVSSNIYDGLVTRDQDLNIIPALATSYENTTPTKWRFNLRKGVTFHNGEAFNAESVKFSFERIYAPGSKSPQKAWFSTIDKIEIINDYTIDIITKKPDPVLPARLNWFAIGPQEYIKEAGDIKFNLNPVGTGPFKFVKWIRDDKVVLKGNESYWGGSPQIKELVFRAMPETQARLAALQTGEVDIATNIPPDLAERLKGVKKFGFKSVLGTRVIMLHLCTNHESPLLKKEVRQAINYSIDRDSIVKHLLMGYGKPIASLTTKYVLGYDPNLKPYPYDPVKAKQLLAAAGYPNGIEITMNGPSGRYMRDKEVCQVVAGQLNKVGIKVNLKILEWGTLISKVTSHTTDPIYLLGWAGLDADLILWPNLHSDEPFSQANDKILDAMLLQARYEMDPKKREKLYFQVNDYIHDQAYLAALHVQKDLYGVSKRVDWQPRGDEMIFMKDVKVIK